MKPELNKNLSLPWTPQGEKASGTIKFSSQEKKLRASFRHLLNAI